MLFSFNDYNQASAADSGAAQADVRMLAIHSRSLNCETCIESGIFMSHIHYLGKLKQISSITFQFSARAPGILAKYLWWR
jgi:hypothetical protein